jgi:hypothetical protein
MKEEIKLPTTREPETEQDKGRCAPATLAVIVFLRIASLCHSVVICRLENRALTQGQAISHLQEQLSRLQSESKHQSGGSLKPSASTQPVQKQSNQPAREVPGAEALDVSSDRDHQREVLHRSSGVATLGDRDGGSYADILGRQRGLQPISVHVRDGILDAKSCPASSWFEHERMSAEPPTAKAANPTLGKWAFALPSLAAGRADFRFTCPPASSIL